MTSNSGQWKPGQSGNPLGGPKDKIVADAIRVAVLTEVKSGRHKGSIKLRAIADKIVEQAMEGQPWAIQMIADRLDGKPLQQSETKVETDGSHLFLEILHEMRTERLAKEGKLIERTTKLDHCNDGHDHPTADAAVAAVRPASARSDGWLIEYEAEEQQAVGLNRPPLLD